MNEMSTNWDQRADEAIDALLNGPGYYLAESVFSAEQVAEANRIINAHSDEAQAATHFHGEHSDKIHLQRRVWNLLNKGQLSSKQLAGMRALPAVHVLLDTGLIGEGLLPAMRHARNVQHARSRGMLNERLYCDCNM